MQPVIESHGLTKRFGSLKAVDKLSLSVGKGELFGLLGPNGSGKTTLIKLLTGQLKPTSGDATVMGVDVLKDPVGVRRFVGVIPEQETPPSFLTAEEYLHFVGGIREVSGIGKRCDKWFSLLQFGGQRHMLCKDLSRGTRQKLMFAQAFIHEPRLVFVDEPVINLDPVVQRTVKDHLTGFVRGGGTVFFSTHVLEIAQEICTRIGVINHGKLIHQGSIGELRGRRLEDFFLKLVQG